MYQIIGYGEDALTYHVLTKSIDEILNKLGDGETNPAKCAFFYRPSFGRGGPGRKHMGECDAILVTPNHMYLIESKWSSSPELRNGKLSECQEKRHAMIRWVADHWDGVQDFEAFCRSNRNEFADEFQGKQLAESDDGIFKRLSFVLKKAHELSIEGKIITEDVYLVTFEHGAHIKPFVVPRGFKLVKMYYEPIDKSNFFQMSE